MCEKLSGAQIIKKFIKINDIKYVFGNPGTTETTFLAALEDTDAEYVLSLHESSAAGIAAGYSMVTKKPSVLNVHTYCGLANSLFNMRNAYVSGIPMMVISGTQDRKLLIHNPVLGGPNVELSKTATKYQYEVMSVDDLSLALQRNYIQAMVEPAGPTFLSIPMDIMQETTENISFKKTLIIENSTSSEIESIIELIRNTKKGKLVFVADALVGKNDSKHILSILAEALNADIYSAPFHVQGVIEPSFLNYKGQLPLNTSGINDVLSKYDTMILLGEKVITFTYDGKNAFPSNLKVIQISPATAHIGFDFPCDIAMVGDIKATLTNICLALGINKKACSYRKIDITKLELKYPEKGASPSSHIILKLLEYLDKNIHLVTEGSSEDAIIQDIALELGYTNVHFSPRGGGLGWAMPLATGISLANNTHSICFVGDGGSLFSIHCIWTAAHYKIPVIYVCFVNNEYRILKELWCKALKTNIESTKFIGLDFVDPKVNIKSIAEGFGAKTFSLENISEIAGVIESAKLHMGPSFILIKSGKCTQI